ncbi:SRPBCC domain-containing protein [Vulgatibacter sp.]|uniref:SRPBCC domain-containing protein n=1 Tax=Vulgatibacter sp. TaxID=1971226 RepID=UPI0035625B66
MASEAIRLSTVVPASPQRIYDAWLDAATHAAFTNTAVMIEPGIGGSYTAGDGYIAGQTLWLDPGRLIVQSWRTSDFPEEAEDSRLEVHLEAVEGGTRVVIDHREIPAGQGNQYEEGWRHWYLAPMERWFAEHPEAAVEEAEDDREIAGADELELERATDAIDETMPIEAPEKKARKPRTPKSKSTPRTTAAKVATRRTGAGARTATARKKTAGSGATRTAKTTTRQRSGTAAGTTGRTAKTTTRRSSGTAAGTTGTRRATTKRTATKRAGAAAATTRSTTRRAGSAAERTSTAKRSPKRTTSAATPRKAAATKRTTASKTARATTSRSTTPQRERRVAGPARKTTARKATTAGKSTARKAAPRTPRPATPRRAPRKPRS